MNSFVAIMTENFANENANDDTKMVPIREEWSGEESGKAFDYLVCDSETILVIFLW